ncbi:hypothetical protein B0T18DRAFT_63124 [Schizothecium vesticola]|uniref:Uncharacterized protein n=1 Tax=Schizothecium vesticola TaxID=314040 RepID=A0AA40F4I4_9PEZI|nr:hypothetical protein B0T18DRAFT_63124 [Schizothecium vesticola]
MQPAHAAKRPSGNRCSRSRLVSDVPVIRDLPSQNTSTVIPPLSPMAVHPHRVSQNTPLSSVDPCRHPPPRFESTSPDYNPCPSVDSVFEDVGAQCWAQVLVSRLLLLLFFFVVVVVLYTDLLAFITETTRYQAHIISLSRFIHCHSFFFSLLCSLPLLSNRLTDDQEKKKVGEEKKEITQEDG